MSFEELLMNMNWNEDITLIFVKIFLKHECLWNPLHPDNKVMFRRKKAHLNIISEFKSATMISLSLMGVKKKIQRLREQYVALVKKKNHKSTRDCIYDLRPKWFHEMDRCLKTVPGYHNTIYAQRSPEVDLSHKMRVEFQSNNSEDINPTQHPPEVGSSHKMRVETRSNDSKDINIDCLTQHTDNVNYCPILRETLLKIENPQSPLHLTQHTDYENNDRLRESNINIENQQSPLQNVTSHSRESSNSKIITVKEDEFDMYGKFVASQLKKISLDKALRLQLQIQNLVCEARLSDLLSK